MESLRSINYNGPMDRSTHKLTTGRIHLILNPKSEFQNPKFMLIKCGIN